MKDFKAYIESDECDIDKYVSDIQYKYSTTMNIYKEDTTDGLCKVNPSPVFENMGMESMLEMNSMSSAMGGNSSDMNVWMQLPDNEDYLASQYEVLAGKLPSSYDEAVIITDPSGEISDYCLYSLGIENMDDIAQNVKDKLAGKDTEITDVEKTSYTYDELMGLKFKLLNNSDYYQKNSNGTWTDKSGDDMYVISKLADALEIKIVGVVKVKEEGTDAALHGGVGYRSDLMEYLVNEVNDSEIVKQQKDNPDVDVFTGMPFDNSENTNAAMSTEEFQAYVATLSEEEQEQIAAYTQQMQASGMTEDEIVAQMVSMMQQQSDDASYEGNIKKMGVSDIDEPVAINIYPKDFETKDDISNIIEEYNKTKTSEDDKISYTDYIGLMLSSVTTIINAITYVLVGFVSISLVVSSIMIGIITYISVLERTKEIGILRAIGASKKDVSRVFNAETFIVGVVSGAIGIGITLLLCIPVNIIVKSAMDISGIASLPWYDGVILIVISMLLTMIAGVIPAKMAAKKDPVVALRSE